LGRKVDAPFGMWGDQSVLGPLEKTMLSLAQVIKEDQGDEVTKGVAGGLGHARREAGSQGGAPESDVCEGGAGVGRA